MAKAKWTTLLTSNVLGLSGVHFYQTDLTVKLQWSQKLGYYSQRVVVFSGRKSFVVGEWTLANAKWNEVVGDTPYEFYASIWSGKVNVSELLA